MDRNVTKPLYESEVRSDLEMIDEKLVSMITVIYIRKVTSLLFKGLVTKHKCKMDYSGCHRSNSHQADFLMKNFPLYMRSRDALEHPGSYGSGKKRRGGGWDGS